VLVSEYMTHDAVGLASLVERREISAAELLEAAIARSEAVNPRIFAIVIPMFDIARARARSQPRGPFGGVPFLIKDLFQDYAGVPATAGCAAWRRAGFVPREHSEIVRRWLSAGTVIFGRTCTPEFGAKGITEPAIWEATRNPWHFDRSPGGSSGGAAAAVAAGIVPVAGASDGGGSIRIPASATGLFGLKPGRGRTPSGPAVGEAMHGAAINHVISRSVRDSAGMLDATQGPECGSSAKIEPPERPYSEEAVRDPRRLRIAFSARSPLGTDVDPAVVAAVDSTARLLTALGHEVEPAEPDIDGVALMHDFLTVWFAHAALHVQNSQETLRARPTDFELDTLAMAAIGNSKSAVDYARSYVRWVEYGRKLSEFLERYDVYMTPTLAEPPPRIGSVKTPEWASRVVRAAIALGLSRVIPLARGTIERAALENLRPVPFTQLANVTGVPAMSVPLYTFPDGLPLGIHFLADHGGEGKLFALAGQLERAASWHLRRPSLEASPSTLSLASPSEFSLQP
jgi:amidase